MARPRSEEKRDAIIAAAIRVIVAQGLSAPTATIAQEAGVANGTLFMYFPSKAELFNQLYLELKTEMATVAFTGMPAKAKLRDQLFHLWTRWAQWALESPQKRRALVQLGVSEDITSATRNAGHKAMAEVAELFEKCRAGGPLRDSPKPFVMALVNALADATMDFMVNDPKNADTHCREGFEALWRVLT
jgi:AcrR family transcriptional regulator